MILVCRMLLVFCLKQNVKKLYKFPFVEDGSPHPLKFDSDTIYVSPPLQICDWSVTIDSQEVHVCRKLLKYTANKVHLIHLVYMQ